ncbi:MAG: methylmalonyl Co-A mutase-associated GTPase MeaB [Anaerolineales bacterium]|nr:methylmalonyl Co-A mutase-associated GTPase MeaB [Anaerolineales bacterium]
MSLVESILSGDRLALARLLTRVENDDPGGRRALDELFPHTGRAHLVGVTGAPGTGKSSLVNQLALHYRARPEAGRVAIVAVDPSSPFTGGALLGDRVRMRDLAGDPGIFIRSMASRGSLGGLAGATAAVVQVFDAAGFDLVLIETVGAGQAEVEIARLAHTTLVVEAPGLGDDIQAIKAGILEVADILVVNKADLPGAESAERALKGMLELAHPVARVFRHHGQEMAIAEAPPSEAPLWIPPVQRTVATDGSGVAELLQVVAAHARHLRQSGEWGRRERARLEVELEALLTAALVGQFRAGLTEGQLAAIVERLVARSLSPWEAVRQLLDGRP